MYDFNFSTWQADLQVQGQPGLQSSAQLGLHCFNLVLKNKHIAEIIWFNSAGIEQRKSLECENSKSFWSSFNTFFRLCVPLHRLRMLHTYWAVSQFHLPTETSLPPSDRYRFLCLSQLIFHDKGPLALALVPLLPSLSAGTVLACGLKTFQMFLQINVSHTPRFLNQLKKKPWVGRNSDICSSPFWALGWEFFLAICISLLGSSWRHIYAQGLL